MKNPITFMFITPIFLTACVLWTIGTRAAHFTDCATGEGNIFNGTAVIVFGAESGLGEGDIVAAFAGGRCVGQGMYTGQNFSFPIWRSDPLAIDVRGFSEGDTLTLKIYGERVARTPDVLVAMLDSVYVIESVDVPRTAEMSGVIDSLIQVSFDLKTALTDAQDDIDVLRSDLAAASLTIQDAGLEIQSLTGKLDQIQEVLNQ